MSADGARRRGGGGSGVKSQSSFYEEDQRRQAGTARPYLSKDGRGGGRRPSDQDTDEGRGRRRQSRSKSPRGYHRPHHFGGRHEQSSRPNHSLSRSYDQHASSTRDRRAFSNRSHDEQSSGSSRSGSYDRYANRYVNPNQSRDERSSRQGRRRSRSRSRDRYSERNDSGSSSNSNSGGIDHHHSRGGQRYQPQVSPYGPSETLHDGRGHAHRSTPYASAGTTSTSVVSSSHFTASAALAHSASAPTSRGFPDLLVSLQRKGAMTDLIVSLGVDDDCRLLRLMLSIGNPAIVNAALQRISQQISAGTLRKKNNGNIRGLIATLLTDFEKNGLPQKPRGVDRNLMAFLGVDDDYMILDFMATISGLVGLPENRVNDLHEHSDSYRTTTISRKPAKLFIDAPLDIIAER